MTKYRVHFYPEHRLEVLRTLRQFNQVSIDNMDVHSIGIIIESDNTEVFYQKLLTDIEIAVNTGVRI